MSRSFLNSGTLIVTLLLYFLYTDGTKQILKVGTSMSTYIVSTTLIKLIFYCTSILSHIRRQQKQIHCECNALSFSVYLIYKFTSMNRYIVSKTLFQLFNITNRQQHEQINCEYKTLSLSFYIFHKDARKKQIQPSFIFCISHT